MRAMIGGIGLVLCGLLACGPGNVAPGDDDVQGDDDASIGDDDLAGDDDAAGGTGTISVTVEVLAVLAEGQSVEAEIVVDGTPSGVFAPAEIEANVGPHTVTLRTNEPNAPVAHRFVATPHEVSVSRDAAVACPMFLGRDLTGTWQKVEENGEQPLFDDPFELTMYFGQITNVDGVVYSPCSTSVWAYELGPLCLMTDDRVWSESDDGVAVYSVNGTITDRGMRVAYTTTFPEFPDEPGYTDVYARVE